MFENRLFRRHPLVQLLLDNWFYLLLLLLIWRLPHLLGDYFDQDIRPRRPQGNQPVYWMGIFIQLYILAILAMSYNLIFGFAGILSFGHALFFGTGVYVLVILMESFGYPFLNTWLVALLIGVIFGLLTALAAFRIKRVYFAMFTLALAQIFHDLARVNLFKFLTEGDDGRTLSQLPPWINPVSNRLTFYYTCAGLMVFTFFFIRRLMNSPTGRVLLAIRDNEERAQTMGYNVALYKTLVIVLAGVFGTLAGVLHAIFTRQAEPTTLSIGRTIDPLFMTIIGGAATHPGPALGAVILHLGETFFRKPDLQLDLNFLLFHVRGEVNTTEIWRVVLGVVFILIVLFIPYGVVGQLNRIWLKTRRWGRILLYDPLIRARPALASRFEPFTGETPALAQALAQSSKGQSLPKVVAQDPLLALFLAALGASLMTTLATWDLDAGASVLLFASLITVPTALILWLRAHSQALRERLQNLFQRG
jgi:branched-chain amino acid transport system permease protein